MCEPVAHGREAGIGARPSRECVADRVGAPLQRGFGKELAQVGARCQILRRKNHARDRRSGSVGKGRQLFQFVQQAAQIECDLHGMPEFVLRGS